MVGLMLLSLHLYGEVTVEKNRTLRDLTPRELLVVVPLLALALFMGVASPYFTRKIEPAVDALVLRTKGSPHLQAWVQP